MSAVADAVSTASDAHLDDGSLRPLAGVRVLDLTRFPPGAYCTIQLADLGAEVIRVEPPKAAGQPSLVVNQVGLSRAKRSITLEMRTPEGLGVLSRLLESCDVVVDNARPGDLDAVGLGPTRARREHPSLIWCSITGFGQDGPAARWAGHDLTYVAQSGLLGAVSRDQPWHPAAMLSVPVGAMAAVSGILTALYHRERTGAGAHLDISLAESALWLLSGSSAVLAGEATAIPVNPGRRLYRCADGEFITVAAAEPRTWAALCDALDVSDLVEMVKPTGDDVERVTSALAERFATRPARDWVDDLGPLGAAVGPVNRGRDIVTDPQHVARQATVRVGDTDVPANPVRLRDGAGRVTTTDVTPPGLVGADTDAVLAAAGYTADEISSLREQAVI